MDVRHSKEHVGEGERDQYSEQAGVADVVDTIEKFPQWVTDCSLRQSRHVDRHKCYEHEDKTCGSDVENDCCAKRRYQQTAKRWKYYSGTLPGDGIHRNGAHHVPAIFYKRCEDGRSSRPIESGCQAVNHSNCVHVPDLNHTGCDEGGEKPKHDCEDNLHRRQKFSTINAVGKDATEHCYENGWPGGCRAEDSEIQH